MIIRELIEHLRCFNENLGVNIEVDTECCYVKVKCEIDDVQFKHGECVLTGYTD